MAIPVILVLILLVLNGILIRRGGKGAAVTAACLDAVPVGFILLLVWSFEGRA